MSEARSTSDLEKNVGHVFKDRALLARALTHASVRSERTSADDNERLEFLGDRVLGLSIALILFDAYPQADEGEMARRFNRLVRRETCADIARSIALGDYLILSESENDSGGREKETILADAMEALLGAIFIEKGFDTSRKIIARLWGDRLNAIPMVSADPKSALQEWAQGKGLPLPTYSEVSREGPDHAPLFRAQVRIVGSEPAVGKGTSKRAAEKAAARALLEREGVLVKSSQ